MNWRLLLGDLFLALQVGGMVILCLVGFMGITWTLAQLIGEITVMVGIILLATAAVAALMLLTLGLGIHDAWATAMRRYGGKP